MQPFPSAADRAAGTVPSKRRRVMRTALGGLLGGLLLTLALAACGPTASPAAPAATPLAASAPVVAPAPAPPLPRVRVAYASDSPAELPSQVAYEAGIVREARPGRERGANRRGQLQSAPGDARRRAGDGAGWRHGGRRRLPGRRRSSVRRVPPPGSAADDLRPAGSAATGGSAGQGDRDDARRDHLRLRGALRRGAAACGWRSTWVSSPPAAMPRRWPR